MDGICSECKREANGHSCDFGIGPVEFWGAKSVDSDVQWVSECCDADLLDESGCNIEPPEPPEREYEPPERD